jgi:hypothetical protein
VMTATFPFKRSIQYPPCLFDNFIILFSDRGGNPELYRKRYRGKAVQTGVFMIC